MPTRRLPNNPSLEHLKHQARRLQRDLRAGAATAREMVTQHHPRAADLIAAPDSFTRADAQLAIARSYGFASWARLRQHLHTVARFTRSPHRQPVGAATGEADLADELLRLACLTYGDGDHPARVEAAGELLRAYPELATASIHTMAATGAVAAARALLAADPALATTEGGPFAWEPMLYCAYSRVPDNPPETSTLEVARLLLAYGADPNAGYLWAGQHPFTALTGAFGGGESDQPPHPHRLALARLLLAAGADANDSQALYNCGFQPPGSDDCTHLELLFAYGLGRGPGGPWQQRLGPHQPSPAQLVEDELLLAAASDRPRAALLVLARLPEVPGARVDGLGSAHPRFEGRTARTIATLRGNVEVAELLADAGAAPPVLTAPERLAAACLRGDRTAVAELLDGDAGLAATLAAARPDLIIQAAELGRVRAVRLLVSIGFDVNVVCRVAPLHLPARHGDLPMVRELVHLGADVTVRDAEHHATPQAWAERFHQPAVAAYLASRADQPAGGDAGG